jgi:hypothetical protein
VDRRHEGGLKRAVVRNPGSFREATVQGSTAFAYLGKLTGLVAGTAYRSEFLAETRAVSQHWMHVESSPAWTAHHEHVKFELKATFSRITLHDRRKMRIADAPATRTSPPAARRYRSRRLKAGRVLGRHQSPFAL